MLIPLSAQLLVAFIAASVKSSTNSGANLSLPLPEALSCRPSSLPPFLRSSSRMSLRGSRQSQACDFFSGPLGWWAPALVPLTALMGHDCRVTTITGLRDEGLQRACQGTCAALLDHDAYLPCCVCALLIFPPPSAFPSSLMVQPPRHAPWHTPCTPHTLLAAGSTHSRSSLRILNLVPSRNLDVAHPPHNGW